MGAVGGLAEGFRCHGLVFPTWAGQLGLVPLLHRPPLLIRWHRECAETLSVTSKRTCAKLLLAKGREASGLSCALKPLSPLGSVQCTPRRWSGPPQVVEGEAVSFCTGNALLDFAAEWPDSGRTCNGCPPGCRRGSPSKSYGQSAL